MAALLEQIHGIIEKLQQNDEINGKKTSKATHGEIWERISQHVGTVGKHKGVVCTCSAALGRPLRCVNRQRPPLLDMVGTMVLLMTPFGQWFSLVGSTAFFELMHFCCVWILFLACGHFVCWKLDSFLCSGSCCVLRYSSRVTFLICLLRTDILLQFHGKYFYSAGSAVVETKAGRTQVTRLAFELIRLAIELAMRSAAQETKVVNTQTHQSYSVCAAQRGRLFFSATSLGTNWSRWSETIFGTLISNAGFFAVDDSFDEWCNERRLLSAKYWGRTFVCTDGFVPGGGNKKSHSFVLGLM